MRPFLTAARLAPLRASTLTATAPRVVPSATLARLQPRIPASATPASTINVRALSTTPRAQQRYERFDTPSFGQGSVGNMHNFLRRRFGGDRGVYIFVLAIGGGVIYYVAHLERVPETGRLRFMDCSKEMEAEMGQASYVETMQQFGGKVLPPNHPVSRRVREVATRIIEMNGLGKMKSGQILSAIEGGVGSWGFGPDATANVYSAETPTADTEWEVYVVDDPKTKNAFVIPGGKIFVFTGILPVAANDDGLATVLGHEVAHVVARHGAERMSSMKVLFGVSFLLEALGIDVGITRLLVTFLLQLPNSRTNESEADTIGLRLMAQACYNPDESTHMWERMSKGEGVGNHIDFMSTHPANAKRIKALSKQLPEAEQLRNQKCSNTQDQANGFANAFGGFPSRNGWQ